MAEYDPLAVFTKLRGCLIAIVLIACVPGQGQPADVHECFILAGTNGGTTSVSDPTECSRPSSPASTFKIPHSLIALQTRVLTETTVFKWDGTAYDFASWRRDHTLRSAIRNSVFPVFQKIAPKIGRERMLAQLAALHYASDTFEGDIASFWINGDLVVSPLEQFSFFERLFAGRLPIDARHVAFVVNAMRMPAGQVLLGAGPQPFPLKWAASTIVRGKTGNTTVNGERVSWLVGAVESRGVARVFVARVRTAGALPNTAGADLAVRELNALTGRKGEQGSQGEREKDQQGEREKGQQEKGRITI
jgi:beta-lactamase class D